MFTEEIIFEGYDDSWERVLTVKILHYSTGEMDIHRQSGAQFNEHIKEAEKVLLSRGLKLDPDDKWAAGVSGIYRRIVSI